MVDFTSALYLGIRHPSRLLKPWRQLTLGVPSALAEPPGAGRVAQALAEMQGSERGVLMPSTFHLFWDLFGMLSKQPVSIYLDEGAYAIARWGVERAVAGGASVQRFRHHDADALMSRMMRKTRSKKRPIVVTDGFCPACGGPAPIGDYLEIVRRFDGLLILDDTQSLGILGEAPMENPPYGTGGGGVLRWSGHLGPDILVGVSLAKGFGVPVAALLGSHEMVGCFTAGSDTRVHCSPPSLAAIHAAEHALVINGACGDRLRRRLERRVRQFRDGLAQLGWVSAGAFFPVQTLSNITGPQALLVHHHLRMSGVKAFLSRPHGSGTARLSFIMTARHSAEDIDRCMEVLEVFTRGSRARINRHRMGDAPRNGGSRFASSRTT